MKPRDLALRLHRWGGLGAGLVVWMLSITGAALLVTIPLDSRPSSRSMRVAPGEGARVPASALIAAADGVASGSTLLDLELYGDPTMAARIRFRGGASAFLDPWTGVVVGTRAAGSGSLSGTIERLHVGLALGGPGRTVVTLGTLVFVILVCLGLWLWWPTTGGVRQALRVETRRGWKRLNYDAHNVLGFFAALLLLVLGGTGILMSFPRLMDLGGRAAAKVLPAPAGLHMPTAAATESPDETAENADLPLVDRSLAHAERLYPESPWYRVVPVRRERPRFDVLAAASDRFDRAHTVWVDPDGALIGVVEFGEGPISGEFRRWINDLHRGGIAVWYRVAVFVACSIGTLLPITGAIIWLPRWRRRRARARADDPG